jgi:hypothetical protein
MMSRLFRKDRRANKDTTLPADGTVSGSLSANEGDDLWYQAYQQVVIDDKALVCTFARQYERQSDRN